MRAIVAGVGSLHSRQCGRGRAPSCHPGVTVSFIIVAHGYRWGGEGEGRVRGGGVVSGWDDLLAGHVVLDTSDLLVLNKPAGLSVTGERHDTDVVRIAADAGVGLCPATRRDKRAEEN